MDTPKHVSADSALTLSFEERRQKAGVTGAKIGTLLSLFIVAGAACPGLSVGAIFLTITNGVAAAMTFTEIGRREGPRRFDKKFLPQLPAAKTISPRQTTKLPGDLSAFFKLRARQRALESAGQSKFRRLPPAP